MQPAARRISSLDQTTPVTAQQPLLTGRCMSSSGSKPPPLLLQPSNVTRPGAPLPAAACASATRSSTWRRERWGGGGDCTGQQVALVATSGKCMECRQAACAAVAHLLQRLVNLILQVGGCTGQGEVCKRDVTQGNARGMPDHAAACASSRLCLLLAGGKQRESKTKLAPTPARSKLQAPY